MNLVSKEYVACREDQRGVLLLSEMAGSLEELDGALPINPYDVGGVAKAIRKAIEMSKEEQQIRMNRMNAYVQKHDVYRWMTANLEAIIRTAEQQ
jgi:trehalose-6-phosphate synthase